MTGKTKRGDRRKVVFLHGLGGSRHDWADVVAELKDVEAHALDLPGSGEAPKPESGYDPVSLARWLEVTLSELGLKRAALVGNSLGARVAGELVSHEPSRASALVLVSPLGAVGYGLTDRLKWKAMSRRAVIQNAPESSMRNATAYGFHLDGAGKKAFVARAMATRTGPQADAASRAVEKYVDGILSSPPLLSRLAGTTVPLMVVAGAHDPLAPPEESFALKKVRPDGRFEKMPGVGHYPMLEAPKAFAKLLAGFLGAL